MSRGRCCRRPVSVSTRAASTPANPKTLKLPKLPGASSGQACRPPEAGQAVAEAALPQVHRAELNTRNLTLPGPSLGQACRLPEAVVAEAPLPQVHCAEPNTLKP